MAIVAIDSLARNTYLDYHLGKEVAEVGTEPLGKKG